MLLETWDNRWVPLQNECIEAKNHFYDSGRPLRYRCKGHFLEVNFHRICIWSYPASLCVQHRACAFVKGIGFLFENARVQIGKRIKTPLATQTVPFQLDSRPLSKGPFSGNPIIPNYSVPIPQGICFCKIVGGLLQKAWVVARNSSEITLSTPACPTEIPPSKGPFSMNIHLIILKCSVPIPRACVFGKNRGLLLKTLA